MVTVLLGYIPQLSGDSRGWIAVVAVVLITDGLGALAHFGWAAKAQRETAEVVPSLRKAA
jgi:hypothetical protein